VDWGSFLTILVQHMRGCQAEIRRNQKSGTTSEADRLSANIGLA
jgi:hypothetical protein